MIRIIGIGSVGSATNLDLSTAGLFEPTLQDRRLSTCTTADSTEDQTVILFSKCITNLLRDLTTQLIMSKGLVQVIKECTGDQKVINSDGLLGHRRRTVAVAKDGVTRSVVFSFGPTRVNELKSFTTLQGPLHDKITGDRVVLEAFEHLACEQFEIKSARITRTIKLTSACKRSCQRRSLLRHFKK